MAPKGFSTEAQGLPCHVVVDRWVGGLAGGGLRFHPDVSPRELRRLARTMTHKWALLGVPFGGCKLGVAGDPTRSEKVEVLETFAREATDFLHDRIITGPDMGTTPREMTRFFRAVGQDGYDVASRRLRTLGHRPSSPEAYRRVMRALQSEITGVAVAHAAAKARNVAGRTMKGTRVSIQGYGSVGRAAAEELARLGARIVALADVEGCLHRPQGLDPRRLSSEAGILNKAALPPGTELMPRDRWPRVEADVLVPAAVADAIHSRDVQHLQAEMIVEAANIPVREEVERELHEEGILVVPDFVVNGGLAAAFGVLVTGTWEDPEGVREEVLRRIVGATERVAEAAVREGRFPREAAVELAERGTGG